MKNIKISNRLANVPSSAIRKLVPYAQTAKAKGVKVNHLNIGDPDVKTPQVMISFLKKWKQNPISYTNSQGSEEFLLALKKYYVQLGFKFIDLSNIQVTIGGSEAISMAIFATCEAGDEILTFEPLYTNYVSFAVIKGVKLIPVLTKIENGFHLPSQKEIEAKITDKTRAILYCNPNNPTGTAYSKAEIEMLVGIAKKYGLFLLADEVYREFIYDGKKHVSLLSYMKQIPEQAVLLDSMSKRYSLCGARLGVLISLNKDIMFGILRMAQARLSAGLVDQEIAAQLTKVPDSYFTKLRREYESRRNLLVNGLEKIPDVTVTKPEGAFYCIAGLPVINAESFCRWLLTDFRLENETVMLAPAAGFYVTPGLGLNEVRIAYVLNNKTLSRCLKILKTALEKYKKLGQAS